MPVRNRLDSRREQPAFSSDATAKLRSAIFLICLLVDEPFAFRFLKCLVAKAVSNVRGNVAISQRRGSGIGTGFFFYNAVPARNAQPVYNTNI